MRAEEEMYSFTDIADLDDDIDDDVPLIELARQSLNQARSNEPWSAIKSASVLQEEEADEDVDVEPMDQDGILEVHVSFCTMFFNFVFDACFCSSYF